MSPEYVRPYVKAQKNDDRDAEAIAEAATRPTMRFVELKSESQLDVQTLHRARDRLVGERTAPAGRPSYGPTPGVLPAKTSLGPRDRGESPDRRRGEAAKRKKHITLRCRSHRTAPTLRSISASRSCWQAETPMRPQCCAR
jgi:hypothetical protein